MPPDRHPIPRDELPPEWGLADHDDGRIAYRRGQPRIDLIADRTEAGKSHPALGLDRYWELCYRVPVAEFDACDSIGHVSTRTAAVHGLLDAMHRIHDRLEASAEPADVATALEEVSLDAVVPEGIER